ncbi:MAG: hypothetical protein K9L28_08730, partial [Synergistales bacterium]|nr:hypothetical protein [Synergistales bacterium]
RARRDGTPITLQGCIHTGETERLDLAIAADGAAPALLGSLPGFPWLESISGEGKARCRLTGPIDHPTYALQLQAPALDTPLGQLGEVRLKAAFDRSQLALDSCSATLGGGRLQLEGTLPLREGDGRLEGRLEGCRPAALSLPGSVTGTFTVSGSAAAPQVAAHLAVEEMSLPLLGRGRAELELAGGSEGLTVRKGLLTAENGRLDATGTLNPLEGTASLTGGFREVRLKATHAALEQIGLYPRGICSGRFSLQYDPEGLRLEADTTATEAGVNGIPLADCSWKATYDGETLTIDPLEARLAGGTLSAEASAESVRGNPGKGSFSASLEEIDLAELPRGILPRRVDLRGRASLECDGTWEDGSLALEGRAGIPALEIDKTARLEELALSFRYGGGEASASLTAGSGEGGVHASGSYDTAGNHWQGRVRMEEITLDRLLPGLPVTGTGDLHISAEAEADKLYTLEGTGELSLRDGSISGYAPIEAMAATSDRNALSFRHLQAGFALCGESLYILPGSRITAEGDNPLYHYLSLDGTLTLDGRIDINGYGTVNVTAMNAFFGALQEIVNAARTDNATEQEVINNMVSGLVTGLSTGDFRPVTFQLAGPLDSPSVNELHVAEKERYSGAPSLPGDSRIDRPHADRKIRLSLSIPAEGGVASGEVEQQLQDQIIDQLIRRLIPEQDHD